MVQGAFATTVPTFDVARKTPFSRQILAIDREL